MRKILNTKELMKTFIFFIFSTIIIYIPVFILYILIDLNVLTTSSNVNLIIELSLCSVGFVIFWILYKKEYLTLKYISLKNHKVSIHLIYLVLIMFFSYAVLETIYIPPDYQNIHRTNYELIYLAISTLIFAPIFEELLFRGIIFEHLLKTNSKLVSIFLTSVIFSILHLEFTKIIGAFIFSLIICTLYYFHKNIILCILGHFIFNSSAFVLYLLEKYELITINFNQTTNSFEFSVFFVTISHLCFFVSFIVIFLQKNNKIKPYRINSS